MSMHITINGRTVVVHTSADLIRTIKHLRDPEVRRVTVARKVPRVRASVAGTAVAHGAVRDHVLDDQDAQDLKAELSQR